MPRMKEAWFSPLHTYPLLATRYLCFFISASSRALGMAESAKVRYSWCTAIDHIWNAVVWEANSSWTGRCVQLNSSSSVLLRFKFWPRLIARITPERLRMQYFGPDPGVLKKLSLISWDLYLSTQTWGLGRCVHISSYFSRLKNGELLPWFECAGVGVLCQWFGASGVLHIWQRHLISVWLVFLL